MSEGGAHLGRLCKTLMRKLHAGVDFMDIEHEARKQILAVGAIPNFAFVNNYGFATCLSLNSELIHAKPRHRVLAKGDKATIDIGLTWQGWQLDMADSCLVDSPDDQFLSCGRQALKKAIAMATPGRHIGHISRAMQTIIEDAGYNIVWQYCGHTIGKELHEDPQIPCFLDEPVERTPLLKPGMALAIEVMMAEGEGEVKVAENGWDVITADGSRALQLEHTVFVTEKGPKILTVLK